MNRVNMEKFELMLNELWSKYADTEGHWMGEKGFGDALAEFSDRIEEINT